MSSQLGAPGVGAQGPAGASGALVLISSSTASASATVQLTGITATYNAYVISLNGIVPGTANSTFVMQLGTGTGPTFSTSTYNWSRYNDPIQSTNASSVDATGGMLASTFRAQVTSDSGFLMFPQVSSSAGYSLSGTVRLFNAPSASSYKQMLAECVVGFTGSALLYWERMGGFWLTTTAVTALQFSFNTGTVSAGTFALYGLANS